MNQFTYHGSFYDGSPAHLFYPQVNHYTFTGNAYASGIPVLAPTPIFIPNGCYQASNTPFGIHFQHVNPIVTPQEPHDPSTNEHNTQETLDDWKKPDWVYRTLSQLPRREPDAPLEKYAHILYCVKCGALDDHVPSDCKAGFYEVKMYRKTLLQDEALFHFGVSRLRRVELLEFWCDWNNSGDRKDMEIYHSARINYRLDIIDQKASVMINMLKLNNQVKKLKLFKQYVRTHCYALIKNQSDDIVSCEIHTGILKYIETFK